VPGFSSDSPLARDLIRIGDEAIAHADDAALRAYFAEDYVFHGPGGDLNFDELRAYFASLRAGRAGVTQPASLQTLSGGPIQTARSPAMRPSAADRQGLQARRAHS
jgi:hypothetical protein